MPPGKNHIASLTRTSRHFRRREFAENRDEPTRQHYSAKLVVIYYKLYHTCETLCWIQLTQRALDQTYDNFERIKDSPMHN